MVSRSFAFAMVLLLAAPVLALPVPPNWPSPEAVQVFRECSLPPVTPNEPPIDFTMARFPAASLKAYAADVPLEDILKPEHQDKYQFRLEVLAAFESMRVNRGETRLRAELPAAPMESLKKIIALEQVRVAQAITKLELALSHLVDLADQRAKEPKRWQTHYDYAVAQLKLRLAFHHEYNLLLAHVRTDLLPNLDPTKGQTHYRLAWSDKMLSNKSIRELAQEARDQFRAIAADHPHTPWAALSQRCMDLLIGLRWEPAGDKK